MKKNLKVMTDVLYYFFPSLSLGIALCLFLGLSKLFLDDFDTKIITILLVILVTVYVVVLVIWARLTPCRQKWDFGTSFCAAAAPWYLVLLLCLDDIFIALLFVFPLSLYVCIPSIIAFIFAFLSSNQYLRADNTPRETIFSRKRVYTLRAIAILIGFLTLAAPFIYAFLQKIDKNFEKNVLVHYTYAGSPYDHQEKKELMKRTNFRSNGYAYLYEIDGLDPHTYLLRYGRFNRISKMIMHPDAREPIEWLTPKALLSNDGETIVADTETLEQFCQFVSNPQNGTPAPNKLESDDDPYSGWVTDHNIRVQFDLPRAIYWHALYEIQDSKVILYAHHHATDTDYAYDVTHILGAYFDLQ